MFFILSFPFPIVNFANNAFLFTSLHSHLPSYLRQN